MKITMHNTTWQYGLGGLLIGGVLMWLFTANGSNTFMRKSMMTTQMDAHFIEQMIPHHEDAITMAKLALTKAKYPEIKQLSESIIDSQSKEIDQMGAWYKEWFGREVPSGIQIMGQHGMMGGMGIHMGMMGDATDVSRLEQAADFDKVFIEDMIPHHQMAVMMANMLKAGSQRPEMQKLADDIITAQTREINQMRQWYDAWY